MAGLKNPLNKQLQPSKLSIQIVTEGREEGSNAECFQLHNLQEVKQDPKEDWWVRSPHSPLLSDDRILRQSSFRDWVIHILTTRNRSRMSGRRAGWRIKAIALVLLFVVLRLKPRALGTLGKQPTVVLYPSPELHFLWRGWVETICKNTEKPSTYLLLHVSH